MDVILYLQMLLDIYETPTAQGTQGLTQEDEHTDERGSIVSLKSQRDAAVMDGLVSLSLTWRQDGMKRAYR